ncbi:MAG: hypothetical protein KDD29_06900 [Flavobacteriales bacterium]|nr:hypothetical protein [Flavobacteriales bacterium]
MPDGIHQVINCKNSYSYSHVIKAINKYAHKANNKNRNTLIIGLEDHTIPFFVGMERGIHEALLNLDLSFSASIEQSRNFLEPFYGNYFNGKLAEKERKENNNLSLEILSAGFYTEQCRVIKQQNFASMYEQITQNKYTVHFADAARKHERYTGKDYIQEDLDELTSKIANETYPDETINFEFKSRKGMAIRNSVTLEVILREPNAENKIHYHSAGLVHGFGHVQDGDTFENSLIGKILIHDGFSEWDVIVLIPHVEDAFFLLNLGLHGVGNRKEGLKNILPESTIESIKGKNIYPLLVTNFRDELRFLGKTYTGSDCIVDMKNQGYFIGKGTEEENILNQILEQNSLSFIKVDFDERINNCKNKYDKMIKGFD